MHAIDRESIIKSVYYGIGYVNNTMAVREYDNTIESDYGYNQEVEELARKGKINCLVVKDLSRFSRNYAESEFEKYRIIQDALFVSDYDRYLLQLENEMKDK